MTDMVHMFVRKCIRSVWFNIHYLYILLLVTDYTFHWYMLANNSDAHCGYIGRNKSKNLIIWHELYSRYMFVRYHVNIHICIGSLPQDTMLTWFKWKNGFICTVQTIFEMLCWWFVLGIDEYKFRPLLFTWIMTSWRSVMSSDDLIWPFNTRFWLDWEHVSNSA